MVSLNKGDLLSYVDIRLPFGWKVKKPLLKDIAEISFNVFAYYQSLITMDMQSFLDNFSNDEFRKIYNESPENVKSQVTIFSLIKSADLIANEFAKVLQFFSAYTIVFDNGIYSQLDSDGNTLGAIITDSNFEMVRDVLRAICGIEKHEEVPPTFSKKQSKVGLAIWEKLKKGQEELEKAKKVDRNYELPNLISAITVRDYSLNFINIWDLTLYQLLETFHRLNDNVAFDINKTAVSVWGDSDNKFDHTTWFKNKDAIDHS